MKLIVGNYYRFGKSDDASKRKYILRYLGKRNDHQDWFIVAKSFGGVTDRKQGFEGYVDTFELIKLIPISESEAVFDAL